jgi:ubiquinone/menaquinone biosynthesis C-methylase UbiE
VNGRYPIARRPGEIERLHLQAEAIAADAEAMLERIGVGAGWRCIDLGCGPRGITPLLARRVGPQGRVVGLDADPVFVDYGRREAPANVEFVQGDAYRTGLPAASFDLVHARFLATTAGEGLELLREAIRLAKRGGFVAFQESDSSSLKCFPPHPAWDRLSGAMTALLERVGGDPRFGQGMYRMFYAEGLRELGYRPFVLGVRSGDPFGDFLPARARHRARRMPRAPRPARYCVQPLHDRAGLGAGGLRSFALLLALLAWNVHAQDCPPVDAAAQKAREEACISAGNVWARFGVRDHLCGIYSCAARTKDAGRPCRNRSDCEHLCITKAAPKIGAEVEGQCSAVITTFGCFTHVDGGRIVGRVCAD